jgi:hypothetical protein
VTIELRRSTARSGKPEIRSRTDTKPNQPFDQEKHETSGHEAAEQ